MANQERINKVIRGASRSAPQTANARGRWFLFSVKWLIALSLLGAMLYLSSLWMAQQLERPVQSVKINGEFLRLSKETVAEKIYHAMESSFIKLDLHRIQNELEEEAWIDRALVARQWPDQLEVMIVEQKPIARWGVNDALNQRGEIIGLKKEAGVSSLLADLPLLKGEPGMEQTMMERYHTVAQLLKEKNLQLFELYCDSTGSWRMTISDDVNVNVGRDHMLEKIDRMLTIFDDHLKPRWAELKSIDLRYFNGVAVAWHQPKAGSETTPKV